MIAKLKIGTVLFSVILMGCVSTTDNRTFNKEDAVTSYLNLARGYLQQGYSEKAIKPIHRALELKPNSHEAYGMQAILFQVQGENILAEQSFRKALAINPSASDIHNNFGAFLYSVGRLEDAYGQFSRAAQDVRYDRRSRAYENMGLVLLEQGNLTRAQGDFEKALKLNGNLTQARLELAFILDQQGQRQQAWGHYQVYTRLTRQTERSLKLGVQLARAIGDKNAAASYSLQLENLYPSSGNDPQ